jgi:hypothetical protein
MYTFICDYCNKICERESRQHPKYKKNKKQYCNPICQAKAREKKVTKPCAFCGKSVTRTLAQISASGNMFCNASCNASFNNALKRKTRRSKCEILLFNLIKEKFPNLEILPNDKTMLDGLEMDIAIPKLKLGIEWNGVVHFKPIYGEQKLNNIQSNDAKKQITANSKGINLIVVPDLVSSEKYVKEAFQEIRKIIEKLLS